MPEQYMHMHVLSAHSRAYSDPCLTVCDEYLQAHLFNDYWEDIGTIKSFFEANLALTEHVSFEEYKLT